MKKSKIWQRRKIVSIEQSHRRVVAVLSWSFLWSRISQITFSSEQSPIWPLENSNKSVTGNNRSEKATNWTLIRAAISQQDHQINHHPAPKIKLQSKIYSLRHLNMKSINTVKCSTLKWSKKHSNGRNCPKICSKSLKFRNHMHHLLLNWRN